MMFVKFRTSRSPCNFVPTISAFVFDISCKSLLCFLLWFQYLYLSENNNKIEKKVLQQSTVEHYKM